MKKLLVFMTLLANVICTYAADELSVTSAGIPKGANGTLTINLSSDVTYAAFQMTVNLPSGLTYVSIANGDLMTTHTVTSSGTTTLTITGSANPTANFTGNSGSLCVITVKAASDATGTDGSIAAGAVLTKADETTTYTTEAVPFNVDITNGLVLDEDDTVIPAKQQEKMAFTLNRTITGGVWNTICLPFEMNGNIAKQKFGDDVKFCSIKSVSDVKNNLITVNFEAVDFDTEVIDANNPYIIKTTNSYETISFTAEDNIVIYPDESSNTISKTKYKFIGTLKAGTVIPTDNLFLSDNKFWYSDGSNTIKGFRGYFWLRDFSSSTGASRLLLSIDGEPTAIYSISSETGAFTIEDGKIYNLNGMELDTPTKKGIYIQNGKKIVVK